MSSSFSSTPEDFLKTVASTLENGSVDSSEVSYCSQLSNEQKYMQTCEQTMTCEVIFLKCSSLSFGTEYWLQNCNSIK